ncbi:RAD3-like DEAD/DEAH box helicase [Vibrio crassostreae]|uniref:helicase-related protein n=1 Tax=Vibrio crassostreae TaxID=246167 RepID=UPI0010479762|nr:helicase-related protein [Vibrio crassostreae]TCN92012.1 RAD3-like DEAD/DEAH box helicase [Vibrio crassostreae]CAK2411873.1 RAD3-like DEAD/DEAH box helicase [Vibrio crassostreae]CAK2427433.1 RAD3-like DEAD/DEAH box helicase [Vibrio crassostreae]CAK3613414.1 RAD3-like DEAD/DEAH box helicase [Vibrio crassostreae]CAK3769021.1 RAD3-like DEAD/DEAH box helicase [Vibrio crassostreae]
MSLLPIDAYQNVFHQQIVNSHLVVEAETGSGKSTRLPIWASQHGRVLVVEPKRIACTSLAKYLAQQSGEKLGSKVGYAIKLESEYNEQTDVVFVTPGIALRWLSEDGLAGYDVIVVDEFHERRWDIDLLVAILKQKASHRLVITSATIEGERLAQYLDANRISCEGRTYQVEIEHRANESRILPDSRHLEQSIAEEVNHQLIASHGDMLVFLPGKKEIVQCEQALAKNPDIQVVKLHASVSDKERDLALSGRNINTEGNGLRKVILATNVAETSLTIPDIGVVIDSGLERRTVQRNGRTTLMLKSISRASAKQRAGRAGRVMDGVCVRLYGEHAALELVTPPELQREELTEPMLAAACCGATLDSLSFLDPIPEKSLNSATQILLTMEAINIDGQVVEHGKKLYPLPIDALYADIVTRIKTKALKEAMVDLTAALSVPARLYQLSNNAEHLEALAQQEKEGCDLSLLIQIVRGREYPHLEINLQALNEAQGLAKQMREVFELPQLEVASRFQRIELLKTIVDLHPELVFVRRLKRKEAFANGVLEVVLGRQNRFPDNAQAMLVLDTHSLPGRGVKQTLTLATVTAPIPLDLIVDAELGDWEQGETVVNDDGVFTEMALVYAGRTITTKLVAAEGQLSLKPIVDLVVSGAQLPGFAKVRTQEIKHWQLYVKLGLDEQTQYTPEIENINFELWFIEQLEMLGVTDVSELEMFDHADIPFDGIPTWLYSEFSEKYPFALSLADLQLDVEYLPARKLIYVHYQSGSRKLSPKRWELPTWSGWRIQYKKASRIIDIK